MTHFRYEYGNELAQLPHFHNPYYNFILLPAAFRINDIVMRHNIIKVVIDS